MRNLKKILALVLALAMSMSLVTIANAADFTDEKDISYEEAVDVMNAIGVIEGFEDGSFNPAGTLTREQAAAIICRMMLGDNAEKLGTTSSSFKDVPASRWSAPYVGYCASLGIIAGNGDGTFNPTGTLTGYAFAKMLLGAVGYDADIEGFVGAGWNLKVAAMASKAGLLNDLTGFVGSEAVTREAAAQMALNTIKATLVEYEGTTIDVSTGDANVSIGNTQYSYVTSNNGSINKNIDSTTQGNTAAYYTLEFGEQYFPNLKLVSTNTRDDFGRPANQWSLSNVTIGKYAKTPAFAYTAAASGDTTLDKVKSMGLKDFKVAADVDVVINGRDGAAINSVNDIPQYTGNGTQVLVYTSDTVADQIIAVVVVKTQLMQINSVKSNSVTLKEVDDDQDLGVTVSFMNMAAVQSDDDCYEALSAMKADDYVLVTPLYNGTNYSVAAVAEPTVVSGALTKINTKSSDNLVKSVVVDGTTYDMSALWTSKDGELNRNTLLSSTTVTTVYLDSYGYAIYAKDVTSSNSVIIIDEIYSSLVDGKIVKYAQGWDANGNEVSLNLGTNPSYPGSSETACQGKVYEYTSAGVTNGADYRLVAESSGTLVYTTATNTGVKAGAASATVNGKPVYFDSSVKFIFLSTNGTDVTGITVNEGVKEVTAVASQSLTYVLNGDGDKIVAVVIPNDNDAANTANLLYVSAVTGYVNNANGTRVPVFTAFIDGEKVEGCVYNKSISSPNALANKFYTYSENDGVYALNEYTKTGKATSVKTSDVLTASDIINDTYFTSESGAGDLNAKNAVVIDLVTSDGISYNSLKEMKDGIEDGNVSGFTVSYIYNGSDTAGAKTVSYMFIIANGVGGPTTGTGTVSSVEIPAGSEISKQIKADSTFNGLGITDANIQSAIQGMKDTKIAVDGNAITVTGSITKSDAFNAAWGDSTNRYYLVLMIDAPKGINATKVTLDNGNSSTVTDGSFMLILGLDGNSAEKTYKMTWEDASGNKIVSSVTLDMWQLQFAK